MRVPNFYLFLRPSAITLILRDAHQAEKQEKESPESPEDV